ncbi:hypothetical protein B0H13DRAFT_2398938 [Mycena leptocephala]|nr:hypothetical protein B0H13DRAFT_2398938 [Mycena leptocephala]
MPIRRTHAPSTEDALHRLDFSFRNPDTHPSILGACRSNLRASTSLRFGAPSLPMPTPQPVVLHTSVSRAAADRYALGRAHRHADPVLTGVRLVSRIPSAIDTPSRTTPAGKARLSVPPNMPPAISSSSTSFFARSHPTRIAGGVLLHAHGDLPPFPVRDATLECAPFTRTILRTPTAVGRSFRVNRPSTTAKATFSCVTTGAAPQHEYCDAAHQGAPEAQEQHYEDYDARLPLSTTAPIQSFLGGSAAHGWKWAVILWVRDFGILPEREKDPFRFEPDYEHGLRGTDAAELKESFLPFGVSKGRPSLGGANPRLGSTVSKAPDKPWIIENPETLAVRLQE